MRRSRLFAQWRTPSSATWTTLNTYNLVRRWGDWTRTAKVPTVHNLPDTVFKHYLRSDLLKRRRKVAVLMTFWQVEKWQNRITTRIENVTLTAGSGFIDPTQLRPAAAEVDLNWNLYKQSGDVECLPAIENTNICGNHEITKEIAKHLRDRKPTQKLEKHKHRSWCII